MIDLIAIAADGRAHHPDDFLGFRGLASDRAAALAALLHLVEFGHLVRVAGDGCWYYALPESIAHREARHACAIRHAPSIARDDAVDRTIKRDKAGGRLVGTEVFGPGHPVHDAIAAGATSVRQVAAYCGVSVPCATKRIHAQGEHLTITRRQNSRFGRAPLHIALLTKATA